jgi:REP element-mobilizing transposase RayT
VSTCLHFCKLLCSMSSTPMRLPRIKAEGQSFYHCVSRVVDRRFIFQTFRHGSAEAERFVRLMRWLEAFSGVRVLTYALMSNHFHLLCQVPEPKALSELELLERKRSSNPIWRLGPVFAQLGSCNKKFRAVVVDDDAAGSKSDGWSMNLKRAAWNVRSSAKAGLWHSARCSDICVRSVRHLNLAAAKLDWWRSVSDQELKQCQGLQKPTWRSCLTEDARLE